MRTWLVDVFVDRSAGYLGNPAGVVVCADGARGGFPPVDRMQAAAYESGLPTLAFVIPLTTTRYRIRWFTPLSELNICGHATVASACYLYDMTDVDDGTPLTFLTNHGPLHTSRRGDDIA